MDLCREVGQPAGQGNRDKSHPTALEVLSFFSSTALCSFIRYLNLVVNIFLYFSILVYRSPSPPIFCIRNASGKIQVISNFVACV